MTDKQSPRDTFMYFLSLQPGLGWFKNIALVSSCQDLYAPFESARIEVSSSAARDNERGQVF